MVMMLTLLPFDTHTQHTIRNNILLEFQPLFNAALLFFLIQHSNGLDLILNPRFLVVVPHYILILYLKEIHVLHFTT